MKIVKLVRMTVLAALGIVLTISSVRAQSEDVIAVFNKKFPALVGSERAKTLSGEVDNSKKQELRDLFQNLQTGIDDMDAFVISPKDPILTFFVKKDFKAKIFKKEPTKAADELTLLMKQAKNDIRDYIADKTQYGIEESTSQRNISLFIEFKKQKHYKEAYTPWTYAFLYSPRAHKAIYISGETILQGLINSEKDVKRRENLIDTLMLLYDQRIKYFGQKGYVLGRKGINLLKYRPANLVEAYNYLGQSVNLQKEKSGAAVLLVYMQATAELFKRQTTGPDGNIIVPADKVINTYNTLNEYIDKALASETNTRKKNSLSEAKKGIEAHFSSSGAANCDALVAIYTPKYNQDVNKNDTTFLRKTLTILDKSGCQESNLHFEMTKQLFSIKPSSITAGAIATRYLKQKDYKNSILYCTKACDLCTIKLEKAQYYYQMAFSYKEIGKKANARTYAEKALQNNPKLGQAYILIGLLYANSKKECGKDAFEQNSVYWIAVDQFIKAKQIDASVAAQANKLISAYTPRFPNNEEAFMHSVTSGKNVKIGCWIQRSTKARF